MAFSRKTWKDRLVEYAGRRKLTNVSTGAQQVVDVVREEGSVSQEGSAFNAANMNDLEQRISDGISGVETYFVRRLGDLEFTYQDGKGFYRAVGADAWIPFKRAGTKTVLRSGVGDGTYNITALVDDYSSLTVDNLIFQVTYVNASGNCRPDSMGYNPGGSVSTGFAPSLSYNPSNGIVSISGCNGANSGNCGNATVGTSGSCVGSIILI